MHMFIIHNSHKIIDIEHIISHQVSVLILILWFILVPKEAVPS